MKPILLIGGGGHCRSCIDVIEAEGCYEIAGIVESDDINSFACMGFPLLGNDHDLPRLAAQYHSALITVGHIKSAEVRIRLFEILKGLGVDLPVIVSPHAYISRHSTIAAGTIVMHGALVNTQVCIGENCIINSQALIEHDSKIESHCHISTGAKINGGVHIETGTFVGSGAVVREGVRIGSHCIVGAGTVVLRALPTGTVFRGES